MLSRRQALIWLALPAVASAFEAAPLDGLWRDAARQRDLPWRFRQPAGAGPWPLVLFSHGLGGSREGGEVWGRAWAAAGLAVLHLQHPGSDVEVLRGGLPALRAAASASQLIARAGDVRFALDEIGRRSGAGETPWAGLQADAIGVAGHSFGAHTTLAVAGQRYPEPIDLGDARPRAFVALSPSSPTGPGASAAHAFGAIARPMLAVTGSRDGDPFGRFDGGESRAAVYDGLPPGRRALLWLDGADHMSFAGDRTGRIPGRGPFARQPLALEREPAHHARVARISALWWRAHLWADAAAAAALAPPQGLGAGDRWSAG